MRMVRLKRRKLLGFALYRWCSPWLLLLYISCDSPVTVDQVTSEGLVETVHSHKGESAVLLNVWATWCQPCVEEFPMIVALGDSIPDLSVVFVSADFPEEIPNVKAFLKTMDVTGKSYIKNEKDMAFIDGLHPEWTGALPFTIVYHRISGSVVDYWEGKRTKAEFLSAIERAM